MTFPTRATSLGLPPNRPFLSSALGELDSLSSNVFLGFHISFLPVPQQAHGAGVSVALRLLEQQLSPSEVSSLSVSTGAGSTSGFQSLHIDEFHMLSSYPDPHLHCRPDSSHCHHRMPYQCFKINMLHTSLIITHQSLTPHSKPLLLFLIAVRMLPAPLPWWLSELGFYSFFPLLQ